MENSSINTNKTLGTNNNHSIIYEQHNPDYIPEKDGGPAVVVADSENNRVAEYQYLDGEWNRSWVWRDSQLRWPRDADRLPNGHTL
ncbi:MAG: arylsulfotransferase (asst), partial [Halobacteriaceae archaeon]